LTSGPTKANYLDTLAAAFAEAGDFSEAVKYQIVANARFTTSEQRKRGEARLILYQQRKPYRQPVR
jgi:hypothetical protein